MLGKCLIVQPIDHMICGGEVNQSNLYVSSDNKKLLNFQSYVQHWKYTFTEEVWRLLMLTSVSVA